MLNKVGRSRSSLGYRKQARNNCPSNETVGWICKHNIGLSNVGLRMLAIATFGGAAVVIIAIIALSEAGDFRLLGLAQLVDQCSSQFAVSRPARALPTVLG